MQRHISNRSQPCEKKEKKRPSRVLGAGLTVTIELKEKKLSSLPPSPLINHHWWGSDWTFTLPLLSLNQRLHTCADFLLSFSCHYFFLSIFWNLVIQKCGKITLHAVIYFCYYIDWSAKDHSRTGQVTESTHRKTDSLLTVMMTDSKLFCFSFFSLALTQNLDWVNIHEPFLCPLWGFTDTSIVIMHVFLLSTQHWKNIIGNWKLFSNFARYCI